ncbi:hypothetical protein F4861DRAFT_521470 [Xylaria intraflava]|nr:hypothetical protein F4861DRAFT_521470 [Xylaria intraflava]
MAVETRILDPDGDIIFSLWDPDVPSVVWSEDDDILPAGKWTNEGLQNKACKTAGSVVQADTWSAWLASERFSGPFPAGNKVRRVTDLADTSWPPWIVRTWAEVPQAAPVPSKFVLHIPSNNGVVAPPISSLVWFQSARGRPRHTWFEAPAQAAAVTGNPPVIEDKPGPRPEIRFRASSARLKEASGYFTTALTMDRKDPPLDPDRLQHFHIRGCTEKSVMIFLKLIHNNDKKIPRNLSFQTMKELAILLNDYRCDKAIQAAWKRWSTNALLRVPTRICEDLMLCIFVSWEFQWQDVFERATKVAISQSNGPLPQLGLPIPPAILAAIESERQKHIRAVLFKFHSLIDHFRHGCRPCSWQCSTVLLGTFIQELHENGFSPKRDAPLDGHSLLSIQHFISNIRPKWQCVKSPPEDPDVRRFLPDRHWKDHLHGWDGCDLRRIVASMRYGFGLLQGLSLSDFPRSDLSQRALAGMLGESLEEILLTPSPPWTD